MKKKSLLILPVLLLALAACNKEDDEVIDENPEITDTTSDDDEDTGGDQGGDEKEELPPVVVDSRIELYNGELAGYTEGVYFENDASLKMADPALDEDGNVVYTLSGTASSMSTSQADEFYKGVAECGDAYVIVTISLKEDEVLSWISSDAPTVTNTMTYEECENEGSEDFIIRLSGANPDGTAIKGESYIFTITDADGEKVTHTLDFSGVSKVPARVAVAYGSATLGSEVTYENEDDLYIASKAEDASGITYTLRGTASAMDENQASDYWPNVANAGDLYFVLTVSLKEDEVLSWTSPAGAKYVEYANAERTGEEDMVLRISGTSSYSDSSATTVAFTITDSAEQASVTHTIDFSSVAHPAPVRKAIATAPCGSLGVLDFSVIDKTISSPERTVDQLNTLFADAWVAGSSATPTNIVTLDNEEGTTLPFSVTEATKVFVGAGGSATSGNTGNTYWQLSTQCIKLSSSSGNGSLTLDFGETAISKVEIEALKWSTSESVTLEVAGTNSVQTTTATSVSGAVSNISAANNVEVETPDAFVWDLGEGANQITISATKRVLIFSITFYPVVSE